MCGWLGGLGLRIQVVTVVLPTVMGMICSVWALDFLLGSARGSGLLQLGLAVSNCGICWA